MVYILSYRQDICRFISVIRLLFCTVCIGVRTIGSARNMMQIYILNYGTIITSASRFKCI